MLLLLLLQQRHWHCTAMSGGRGSQWRCWGQRDGCGPPAERGGGGQRRRKPEEEEQEEEAVCTLLRMAKMGRWGAAALLQQVATPVSPRLKAAGGEPLGKLEEGRSSGTDVRAFPKAGGNWLRFNTSTVGAQGTVYESISVDSHSWITHCGSSTSGN